MNKNPGSCDDPMKFRLLLILNCTYRRWASARLETLRPCVEKWAKTSIYAGAIPQGAPEALYHLAINIEHAILMGQPYSGGAIDIAKFVDRIPRPIVYMIAKRMGMPGRILDTYIKFQEN